MTAHAVHRPGDGSPYRWNRVWAAWIGQPYPRKPGTPGWLYVALVAALLACLGFVPWLAWRQYRKAQP